VSLCHIQSVFRVSYKNDEGSNATFMNKVEQTLNSTSSIQKHMT